MILGTGSTNVTFSYISHFQRWSSPSLVGAVESYRYPNMPGLLLAWADPVVSRSPRLTGAGDVQVAGHDLAREPDAVRAAIGVTGQFSAVDNLLTGEENLLLMADLHHLARGEGRRRVARLLEQFDLTEAGRKPASTYSGACGGGSTLRRPWSAARE
jgi:hypothetical protein